MGVLQQVLNQLGYAKITPQPATVEKSEEREAYAQNPMASAFQSINTQFGLRKPSKITFQTLRRMADSNWVDRTCITTLRDEITAVPWDIVPLDTKQPYDEKLQRHIINMLKRPNPNNENWRTLIDKVVEDILVVDAGCIEKVRNSQGFVVELWHVDGATIKPMFDEHGVVGKVAYQQWLPGQQIDKAAAEWRNDDLVYIMWNPQGAINSFGYGMSPVEAGLAVGTAFLYAEAYNLGFFKANTIPPVIINVGQEVPEGEVEKFRTFLAAEMMGNQGFHTPMIGSFGQGFDIKNLLTAPKDMAWKEYVEWQMRWKVALYRMSPQDIGFTLDQYKTEGSVQQNLSKNKAIDSLKGVIKNYIDTEIIGDIGFERYNDNLQFHWIDTDSLDPLDQANVDKIYTSAGVLSINEVRQAMGKDPISGGEKPFMVVGQNIVTIDPTPTNDEDTNVNQQVVHKTIAGKKKTVNKSFDKKEGNIVEMFDNSAAIAWMDDRGVTQPLFITDEGKTQGFQIKTTYLDERKDQNPPEAEVAHLLRGLAVNTPEVRICTYDEVLRLLPDHLYAEFTKWIALEPPYDSKTWRQRWGDTRQSNEYIITGYISGADLGNEQLQKEMAISPASYINAVKDLGRVWVAERMFYLGDRKPGHYIITNKGNGFGVDYQFYKDKNSYDKTKHFLPKVLLLMGKELKQAFDEAVIEAVRDMGQEDALEATEKHFKKYRPHMPRGWERMRGHEDIEKDFAKAMQRGVVTYYHKALGTYNTSKKVQVKRKLKKAREFDPLDSYVTNGEYVMQNGVKYPMSVIPADKRPGAEDFALGTSDYGNAYDYGAQQAQLLIKDSLPDIIFRNPEMYQKAFQNRINLLTGGISNTLAKGINDIVTEGLGQGASYGMMADKIQAMMGVDPSNPDMPSWRAERIARTESEWAATQGMVAQYQNAGVTRCYISPAPDACEECTSIAADGPFDMTEVGNIVPIHPNCRCVVVGDYSQWLD